MGMKTGIIRYNVKQRGRQHRGVDRNFETKALMDMINGGEVQERVKMRDMHGFYGHWPRVRFGMNPMEGGILDGRHIPLEPSHVTTYLKMLPDGTIEHEAEFLDTAPGRVSERLFKSKAGGFSSAIDVRKIGNSQCPTGFFGFDYVLEPNFTHNRGYALDSVAAGITLSDDQMHALDDASEYNHLLDSTDRILHTMQAEFDRMAQALVSLEQENAALMSMAVNAGKGSKPVLDGVFEIVHAPENSRFDSADEFRTVNLSRYEDEAAMSEATRKAANVTDRMIQRRFGS